MIDRFQTFEMFIIQLRQSVQIDVFLEKEKKREEEKRAKQEKRKEERGKDKRGEVEKINLS